MAAQPRGEIYDIGYRRYEGPREGRNRARAALWINGVRTALGIGRGTLAKILPILLFASTMLPAVIFVFIAYFTEGFGLSDTVDVPSYPDYFGVVSILALLFSAIIAPELLCADRRSQVLQLYLVRPLTSTDYVAGRWLAFFTIALGLVYSGQVVMFFGYTLAAAAPLDYLRDNWLAVPRFLAAGAVVAAFITTIPLTVAGFTTRRAYAAGFVIGLFVISSSIAQTLVGGTGEWLRWVALLDLLSVPTHITDMIFDQVSESGVAQQVSQLNSFIPIAWYLALTAGSAGLLLWRYRQEGQ